MRTTSATELRKNMKFELDKVSNEKETIIIHRASNEDVVMIPLSEWNSWTETKYLLSSKNNINHLYKSINEAESGETTELDISELW